MIQVNVFLLDSEPLDSASYLVDDHVAYVTTVPGRAPIRSCKMAIEACQLLSSAHWFGVAVHPHDIPREDWPAPYLPTHQQHPWAVAVRSSRWAYCLVREHAQAMLLEHEYRTGRTMASVQAALDKLWEPPVWLESRGWRVPVCRTGLSTEYVQCVEEAVPLYREAYIAKIKRMPRYTKRHFPPWMSSYMAPGKVLDIVLRKEEP